MGHCDAKRNSQHVKYDTGRISNAEMFGGALIQFLRRAVPDYFRQKKHLSLREMFHQISSDLFPRLYWHCLIVRLSDQMKSSYCILGKDEIDLLSS
jgi:hypothetical protein